MICTLDEVSFATLDVSLSSGAPSAADVCDSFVWLTGDRFAVLHVDDGCIRVHRVDVDTSARAGELRCVVMGSDGGVRCAL